MFFFLLPVVSIFIVLYVHRINVLKTFDLIVIPWALILLTSTNNHGFVFQTLPVLINIIIPMLKMFSEHQNNFNVERIWLVVSAIFASVIVIVSFSSSDFFFFCQLGPLLSKLSRVLYRPCHRTLNSICSITCISLLLLLEKKIRKPSEVLTYLLN